MKRWLVGILVLVVLAAAPAFGCEDCILGGQPKPNGLIASRTTCYSWTGGAAEGCYVLEDFTNCKLWSYTENACPETSKGGGTGSDPSSGGGCTYDSTGACPANCASCTKNADVGPTY
jgi:hypothetical protein